LKIDLSGAFNIFNEIYHIRRMSIAERILIRQKKDFINYIAIHFWSIIKTIIVVSGLILLTQFPDQVPLKLFWVYFLTGMFFLIFDSLGIRAVLFFFKKFFQALFKMFVEMWNNIKQYFLKISAATTSYRLSGKILYWIVMIIFFPVLLGMYILGFGIVVGFYGFIFGLLVFNGNEALSLLIMNSIGRALPLGNEAILYLFYVVSSIVIYYSIDYRIWMTEGSMINKETKTEGHNEVVGLELLNTNNRLSIYQKDEEFLVLDNDTDTLTIFEIRNRLKLREKEIVDWINKRKQNKEKRKEDVKNEK
jgi:hypothetical protein